jgi:hypothetical protein
MARTGDTGHGRRGDSDTGLAFFPVDVLCGCGDSHPSASAGTTGCGASFRVELRSELAGAPRP